MNYALGCDLNQTPKYVGLRDDGELSLSSLAGSVLTPVYTTHLQHLYPPRAHTLSRSGYG